jgi:asparagine synthase (glutamine-hydrolysing)
MCGIAGYTFKDKSLGFIQDIKKDLYKRGPDYNSHYQDENIVLINTRLKIQDIKQGNQPYFETAKDTVLVYNGELYNKEELKLELEKLGYILTTDCDTEIVYKLLNHFGVKAFVKINGMFALAFYNKKTKETILARDRYGVKPLFYTIDKSDLFFSSQINSLRRHDSSSSLNEFALLNLLSHNYITENVGVSENIKTLKAGSYAVYTKASFQEINYWDLSISNNQSKIDLGKLLNKSVSSQMIGERKVGVFLSSGIDSSAIAYYAKKNNPNLKTYCVGFKESTFDESEIAKSTAKFLKTDHKTIYFTPQDFIDNIGEYTKNASQPLSDLGAYPLYFLSKSIKDEITVLLSGDGADEVFGGYATLKASLVHKFLKFVPNILSEIIFKVLNIFLNDNKKEALRYRVRKFKEGLNLNNEMAHYFWRTVFTVKELKKLTGIDYLKSHESYIKYFSKAKESNFKNNINKYMYADFKVWLPQNNFAKLDLATMSHSLEGRVPYMDNDLVDYVFNLPVRKKWSFFSNKKILRDCMKGKLPDNIVKGKKSSFHPPYQEWFKTVLYDHLRDVLLKSNLIKKYNYSYNYIDKLLINHKNGVENNSYKIFALYFLENWLQGNEKC